MASTGWPGTNALQLPLRIAASKYNSRRLNLEGDEGFIRNACEAAVSAGLRVKFDNPEHKPSGSTLREGTSVRILGIEGSLGRSMLLPKQQPEMNPERGGARQASHSYKVSVDSLHCPRVARGSLYWRMFGFCSRSDMAQVMRAQALSSGTLMATLRAEETELAFNQGAANGKSE